MVAYGTVKESLKLSTSISKSGRLREVVTNERYMAAYEVVAEDGSDCVLLPNPRV